MASSSRLPLEGSDSGETPRVLVVDDNPVDRKYNEQLLTKAACKVTTAESGHKALEILGLGDGQPSHQSSDLKVDLIITDYSMPGMTGYELLKKIKGSSTMKEIPVVIVSSENNPIQIKECLDEGAQEFILKPLKQSDVNKLRCQIMNIHQTCKQELCTEDK